MNLSQDRSNSVQALTARELYEQCDQMVLLDIRNTSEYEWKHIPGSLRINSNQILQQVAKDKSVAIICLSGCQSLPIIRWLFEQGYQRVYSLEGGFFRWWQLGYPVISGAVSSAA